MNPIPEPTELLESECNAQGLYGLPKAELVRQPGSGSAAARPASQPPEPDAGAQEDDTDQAEGV
jgi:hypothetical protein